MSDGATTVDRAPTPDTGAPAAGDAGDSSSAVTGPLEDSLLTREGDGGAAATGDGGGAGPEGKNDGDEGGQDVDPAAMVPETPEGYAISFDAGISVDESLLNGFKAEAHSLGIPQGQAQKLADFYVRHAAESARAVQNAQDAALIQAKKGWESEIMARPEFKQEVIDARRTLKAFGGPELDPLLQQSMLGSHPAFFDFVVKVGKALAEPDSKNTGNGGGKDIPLMDRLWPDK